MPVPTPMPTKGPTPYTTLDLPTTASARDIKLAYHKSVLANHPDRTGTVATAPAFRLAQAAYEILFDANTKAEWDSGLSCEARRKWRETCKENGVEVDEIGAGKLGAKESSTADREGVRPRRDAERPRFSTEERVPRDRRESRPPGGRDRDFQKRERKDSEYGSFHGEKMRRDRTTRTDSYARESRFKEGEPRGRSKSRGPPRPPDRRDSAFPKKEPRDRGFAESYGERRPRNRTPVADGYARESRFEEKPRDRSESSGPSRPAARGDGEFPKREQRNSTYVDPNRKKVYRRRTTEAGHVHEQRHEERTRDRDARGAKSREEKKPGEREARGYRESVRTYEEVRSKSGAANGYENYTRIVEEERFTDEAPHKNTAYRMYEERRPRDGPARRNTTYEEKRPRNRAARRDSYSDDENDDETKRQERWRREYYDRFLV